MDLNSSLTSPSAGERLVSNLSRFVLIVWVFAVLILTQSYTASLASMLTVQSLQPAFIDIKEIKQNNYFVGYQNESFVKTLLTNQLGFNNGGVAAIFDEIPYIKLLLTKYCTRYAIVGPTYKTDGFGFAFPLKSPLVSYFSRAILNVTADKDKFEGIKYKYFLSEIISEDQSASITSNSQSLTVHSFAGLFIITAIASVLSLLFYVSGFLYSQWPTLRTIYSEQTSFWSMGTQTIKHFDRKDSTLHSPINRSDSRVNPNPIASPANTDGDSITDDGTENHLRTLPDHSDEADVVVVDEDSQILSPGYSDAAPHVQHSS